MAKRAGVIEIQLSAGTAKFVQDMETAKAKVIEFGSAAHRHAESGVSEMRATSAAFKTLEGHITNNFRAADAFAEHMLGLGPILKAAFPLVGAIAFGGMVFEIGEKVVEFFKKMREGPERVADAFRKLHGPLRATNDELQLANDRLENDIAKLEGHRQNGLKIALDEAVISANKLADSLDADLEKLTHLLKAEKIGQFAAFLTQQAPTSGLEEENKKFRSKVGEITRETNENVRAGRDAGDKEATAKAAEEGNRKLKQAYDEEVKLQTKHIREVEVLDRQRKEQIDRALKFRTGGPAASTGMIPTATQSNVLEVRKRMREQYLEEASEIGLRNKNAALAGRVAVLRGDAEGKQKSDPFTDRINLLNAKIQEAAARLAAAGKDESAKVLAKAYGDAAKVIAEVNKELGHHQKSLTDAQKAMISQRVQADVMIAAEADWKTHLALTTSAIQDRIRSQEMLTAAIGRGYEAVKHASVETGLMQAVGSEKFNDPKWMAAHQIDVGKIRSGIGSEYDAKNREQIAATVDKLGEQIELEKSLAAVEYQGAEAIRMVTLAYKLREITMKGGLEATKDLIKAEIAASEASRARISSANIAKLDLEIDAIKRLAAAEIEGAEATRNAHLNLKYEQMQRSGAPREEIDRARLADELAHQGQITAEVAKTVNADKDRVKALDDEQAALNAIRSIQGDTLGIAIKQRDIDNERVNIAVRQLLEFGTARDGVRAFFIEMQKAAQSSASIIFTALTSAFDRVSANMAKLVTGQKTAWGQMFKDIGNQMVEATIKQQLARGLDALGRKMGVPILVRRDGQTAGGALMVEVVGSAASSSAAAASAADPSSIIGKILGKMGGIFTGSQGGMIFNARAGTRGMTGTGGTGGFGGRDGQSASSAFWVQVVAQTSAAAAPGVGSVLLGAVLTLAGAAAAAKIPQVQVPQVQPNITIGHTGEWPKAAPPVAIPQVTAPKAPPQIPQVVPPKVQFQASAPLMPALAVQAVQIPKITVPVPPVEAAKVPQVPAIQIPVPKVQFPIPVPPIPVPKIQSAAVPVPPAPASKVSLPVSVPPVPKIQVQVQAQVPAQVPVQKIPAPVPVIPVAAPKITAPPIQAPAPVPVPKIPVPPIPVVVPKVLAPQVQVQPQAPKVLAPQVQVQPQAPKVLAPQVQVQPQAPKVLAPQKSPATTPVFGSVPLDLARATARIGVPIQPSSSNISRTGLARPVSPDRAYLTGENRPEILMGGRVSSNADSKRMMGSPGTNIYYSIDARGTDPVQTEQRVRAAIIAAHNSAVVTGVQANAERINRTPQR